MVTLKSGALSGRAAVSHLMFTFVCNTVLNGRSAMNSKVRHRHCRVMTLLLELKGLLDQENGLITRKHIGQMVSMTIAVYVIV